MNDERPCVCRTLEVQVIARVREHLDRPPADPTASGDEVGLVEMMRAAADDLRANHRHRGWERTCTACLGLGRTPCHFRPCPDCGGLGTVHVDEGIS